VLSQENNFLNFDNKSFNEINEGFYKNIQDSLIAIQYANAYLEKAVIKEDTLHIAFGYFLKSMIEGDEKIKLHTYDTIIELTKNFKNKNFPSIAYYDKGAYYHNKRMFKPALDNYLLALTYNDGSIKENLDFLLKSAIGNLKNRINDNQEALKLFKENWEFVLKNNFIESSPDHYFQVLFSLTDSYRKNDSLTVADKFNKLGLKESINLKDSINYYHFVLNQGLIDFYLKKYDSSKFNIEKGLEYLITINDNPNIAVGYYYRAMLNLQINNEEKAVRDFKRVDSIFQITNDILPEIKDSYTYLIDYYKKNSDLENQLFYIERLIQVDEILTENFKYLSKNITQNYDIPTLLLQKQNIINQLNKENELHKKIKYFTLLLALITAIFGVYQYFRRKSVKRKFNELMNKQIPDATIFTENEKSQLNKIESDIPIEIINLILSSLSSFETNKDFLDKKITLNSLAKKINTNSTYLSKVINTQVGMSFSNYLKKIRVEYALQSLKENKVYTKYSIKVLAEEFGFNSAESFTKAFYKELGIYPSEFIKNLIKTRQ
jgi:AraC-like DNA-binding protein